MNRLWDFDIQISLNSDKAVYIQIVDAFILAIRKKRLKSGEILLSSRKLAAIIGVNRNTIIKAQDILIAEGWLVSKNRTGVFVAELTLELDQVNIDAPKSQFALKKPLIVIDDGVPDTKIAPIKELASAYRRVFDLKSKLNILGYTDSKGSREFRNVISQMLNHRRGMNVTSDEVCITRGSQMALYLIAHALFTQKDIVLVENPGYQPAWKAFRSAGAIVVPISVDNDGLKVLEVEAMLQKKSNVKAIYITPHHQYPTTVSLSLKRRLKLVELSNKYNFIIIEDDYDHEFHFDHRPILPISSLPSIKNYVYIGTFSKIIAPSLRIGFLVCNVQSINEIASLREVIDVQNDSIMERAIIELIQNGDIKRHLKRASKNYIEKREYCDNLLKIHLKDKTHYNAPTGGLAFWIRPLKLISLKDLTLKLEMNGIQITDASKYCIENSFRGFRLGYGSLSKNDLEKVIIKLGELL